MNLRPLLALTVLGLAVTFIPAQLPPDLGLAALGVVDDLNVTLWAAEPQFVNPTCFDVDHKGRVWVCESVNYRSRLRNQPLKRAEGDRIVILEDAKGTGKADAVKVFYQSPELLAPLGIAVVPDASGPGCKVYVCQSPNLWLFEDKDGDLQADGPPKVLLKGFRGLDHDHGIHSVLVGPDNRLYFTVGDQGVENLVDRNGKKWTTNSTDCRAGTVWRCDLDGKNLELIAHNFRNNYECAVDSFGTVFLSDNDDDGNQQTRICYVMPGGNYGYHPRGAGQTHWHEEQPGVVPKALRTFFGSPTGMCFYEGTLLPERFRGSPLHTDAGPRHLRCYKLKPDGAGYDMAREDIVQSEKDNWFRPSDVAVAPDGSVFVADWYDPGVGGHGMGDTTRGRIYRVAPKGQKPSVPAMKLDDKDGLLAALGSPNLSMRAAALARIDAMPMADAVKVLDAGAVSKDNPVLRARAIWMLGRRGSLRFVTGALEDNDPRFRILAMRVLKDFHNHSPADYVDDVRKKIVHDPDAAVRREALLLLRDVPVEKARPLILELAKQYDGKEFFTKRDEGGHRFYLAAVGIAVGTDKARRDAILSDFSKEFPTWNNTTAALIWELRPASALPQLEKNLADASLPAAQRGQIVDIIAGSDDKEAGLTLMRLLAGSPPAEVRDRVLAGLKAALPNKWRDLRASPELGRTIDQLLTREETRVSALELIAAGELLGKLDVAAGLTANGKEPMALRTAAVQTLGVLPSPRAAEALANVLAKESRELRPAAIQALGKLAAQKPDVPGANEALKVLQKSLTAGDDEAAVKGQILAALAGTRAGTIWLLDLKAEGKLADDLKAEAGRLLRNSPYQDLRNKALAAFPAAGKLDPKKLPSPAELAKRTGSAERGKKLLMESAKSDLQCAKCHAVRGVGGAVGPDLAMIGKKASRENLLESILIPSKAIADQYLNWQVETTKGLSLTGLLVEETPQYLVLRDANGKDTKIDQADVDSRKKSPNSLMPTDIVAAMSEAELTDVVEYLLTLKTAALTPDTWMIAGPFPDGGSGLDRPLLPEKGFDPKATFDGKFGKVGWRKVTLNSQGYVDLMAFHGDKSKDIVSYLFAVIESPADQDGQVLLGTDDGAKLWLNGEQVFEGRATRAAAPEQDVAKVKLKKGRNELLLKIANGDGPHGFYLTVVAEQELKRVDVR